jgi:hypothetical protein
MTNFISLKITNANPVLAGIRLLNVNNLKYIATKDSNTLLATFTGDGTGLELPTSTGDAIEVLNAINAAIGATPGGQIVEVDLPAGVTINYFGATPA